MLYLVHAFYSTLLWNHDALQPGSEETYALVLQNRRAQETSFLFHLCCEVVEYPLWTSVSSAINEGFRPGHV